jgi:hypothetical protein
MRRIGATPRGRARTRAHPREGGPEAAGKVLIIKYIFGARQFNGGSWPQP